MQRRSDHASPLESRPRYQPSNHRNRQQFPKEPLAYGYRPRRSLQLEPRRADARLPSCNRQLARTGPPGCGMLRRHSGCSLLPLSLRPALADARSGLLNMLSFHAAQWPAGRLAEARRYGAVVTARAKRYKRWPTDAIVRAPAARPLRAGLVGGDLRTHPVGFSLVARVSVPESLRKQFTETNRYLPDTRFCLTPPHVPINGCA